MSCASRDLVPLPLCSSASDTLWCLDLLLTKWEFLTFSFGEQEDEGAADEEAEREAREANEAMQRHRAELRRCALPPPSGVCCRGFRACVSAAMMSCWCVCRRVLAQHAAEEERQRKAAAETAAEGGGGGAAKAGTPGQQGAASEGAGAVAEMQAEGKAEAEAEADSGAEGGGAAAEPSA